MARKSKVSISDLKVQLAAPSAALDKKPNPASSPPVTDGRIGGRDDAAQLRALLRASGVGLWDWDLVTNTVYFSPEWKRQLGYDDHELPDRFEAWEERLHPADIVATLAAVNDYREGRRNTYDVEFRLRHKDGSWRWILASGNCARDTSGVPVRLMGSHIDITQRKRNEALWNIQKDVLELIAAGVPLKQSLTTLARGLEALCEGVICSVLLIDRDGVHLRHGAAPGLPESFNQAVDGIKIGPKVGSCGTAAFRREQVIVEDIEQDALWADYKQLALSHGMRACWSMPIFDRQRTVLGTFAIYYRQPALPTADHLQLIAMATDIAAIAIGRERTEAALRVSDIALRSISQGVVITSPDGSIQSVTPAFTAITGYDAADLLGQPCTLLMAGMDAHGVAAINNARQSGESFAGEILDQRKDGSAYWNDLTLHPVRDEQGQLLHVVGVSRDVSARKQAEAARASLEAQLRESQKMEAIGTLAGGIAHDFNNIIAAILGNVDLATMDAAGQPPVLESLGEIRKASTRARDLVQRILSFSRRQPSERRMTSLVSVVDESVRLLRTVLPGRLTLKVACASDVPEVPADAHHMEQVILNLVTNAMQALAGEKGRIAIRLDTTVLDAALAQTHPALGALFARHSGRVVTLSVSDDGPGMDKRTMSRIFEPFFTTKSVGSGTGLGLSVVHGIVQEHDGAIVVESQLGKGATFTIYLPVIPALPSAEEPQRPAVHAEPGNGVHILYLDDEAALVSVLKRVLERRGYRISGFTDQQQALDALRADAAAFDLVVSDYNMPDITGLDEARAVRDIRPDLPVVIATGFIDEVLRQQAGKAGVREFVSKAGATEGLTDAIERLAQSLVRASPTG